MEYLEWIRTFIFNYPALQYLVVYLGAAFGGEVAMIALSFLSAQGFLPFWPFLIVSFLGVLSSDSLWFFMGKTKMAERIFNHKYATATVIMITEAIHKVSRGNHLFALVFAKFLIGTRVVLILYVSKSNLSFKRFIVHDTVAIIVWLLVVVPIGFLSGLGFTYFSHILENIYAGIGFLILVLVLCIMMQMWLKRLFTKEGEEIMEEENML